MAPLTLMRHHKRAITLLFAISVLSVISCDVICAADIDWVERFKIAFNSTSLKGRPDNHNHFRHARNSSQNSPLEIKHFHSFQANGEAQANCCNNHTNQFYQSLYKSGDNLEIKSINLSSVHFARFEAGYLSENVARSLNFNAVSCLQVLPPIAGGRLRVLINSFLIWNSSLHWQEKGSNTWYPNPSCVSSEHYWAYLNQSLTWIKLYENLWTSH